MYEERKNSYSLRDLILQILLIVLFVLIMVWLFPTKNYLKEKDTYGTNELYTNYVDKMRDAAVSYFTVDRVPSKIGDTAKLTLKEMLDNKMLFQISGNASCSVTDSYVEVTKMDKDYQLKVALSCDEFNDYILVTLGCTDFCTVCPEEPSKPTTKPTPQSTKKYTVKFDSQGGTPVASQTVKSGAKAKEPVDPTKSGYTFIEWTLNGVKYDFNKAVKSNITLVASWKKNTVTYYKYRKPINDSYSYYTDWSNWSNTETYWGSTNLPYANTDLKQYTVVSSGTAATGETTKSCTNSTVTKTVVVDTKTVTTKTESANPVASKKTNYTWVAAGQVTSEVPLRNSSDTRYTFVTTRVESDCDATCTNKIVYVYNKETRKGTTTTTYSCPSGYNQSGSGASMKCTKSVNTCDTYGSGYTMSGTSCIKYGTKTETVQKCQNIPVTKQYVKYQTRTRSIKNGVNTSYVYEWSTSSNDAKLIAAGYTYMGVTETK